MTSRLLLVPALAAAIALAACGGSSSPRPAAPAKLEHFRGARELSVVLTPLGARRVGIRTAAVAGRGRAAVVPYGAVVYEPDGTPIVYTNPAPRVFTRRRISIARVDGGRVYVRRGLAPRTRVVTVGAEELFGVQSGVGGET